MKKTAIFILALFFAAVLLCLLCGCSRQSDRTVQHDWDRLMLIERYKDFDLYADTETGVEYLVFEHSTGYHGYFGITPVFNPDGTPVLAPNFDAREDDVP